ncbi:MULTISPECIES: ferredoxin [Dehalobacter]|jgi:ferredoxin|uniref:Ferredoxin n=2 Tax=Dehalobacter restrictus TaxID=55583 RepID=A0A857DHB7_9FIRM|nr:MULTISPECIES: ferredoxin [Dehalobacter]AHF10128.1 ferredoxin [Dehalobacter restrictus DSM 9455]MCG1025016.1 ferredoxin [Dehalobacter sp.]MDJ0305709.1 ferredoxin [Dehalobacter sp.]OCZ52580.1 ferredoxin [Dehalobacter sp. TeCB1]QHA00730.1 ferredoxin [Dehalobacter restrictus]
MIAYVEKEACIGCGACPAICPDIFEMDDDGLAVTLQEQVPEVLEESAQEAADGCPTEAIIIS